MFRKTLVGLMVVAMVLAFASVALAADITPETYTYTKDWNDKVQGVNTGNVYTGYTFSTHKYGTWNSPYTEGIDGYNYNDAQEYTGNGDQVDIGGKMLFRSGPHGGYLTSTHRCRECHAVHRAAGKFKLLRSDTRFEACDWCHGNGACSGFNIQMDNDDAFTTEYNVGHTMGFGVQSGKWKAPDDTFPAFTPNYWQGGFSCFDCHSPHANPQRLLGYNDSGSPVGLTYSGKVYGIINPGHGWVSDGAGDTAGCSANGCHKGTNPKIPLYLSGSWLLIKNPDREIASVATSIASGIQGDPVINIIVGSEIPDAVTAGLMEFDTSTPYPINKIPTDWSNPIGSASTASSTNGYNVRNAAEPYWNVSEFCTDCHDGNAGLHTVQAPLFSEDRALRATDNGSVGPDWKNSYDLAYGHDAQPRHCARQMKFNPEDEQDFGPHCRNCHKGSSGCGRCHGDDSYGFFSGVSTPIWSSIVADTADNSYDRNIALTGNQGASTYHTKITSTAFVPGASEAAQPQNNLAVDHGDSTALDQDNHMDQNNAFMFKKSRTIDWDNWTTGDGQNWRKTADAITTSELYDGINAVCSDDGFSWPHRTMGWKMLKDDLFGLDFDGSVVQVGDVRSYGGQDYTVHDLDSVCLDCHNPTVWRATSASDHVDDPANANDDNDDELLTRGLP